MTITRTLFFSLKCSLLLAAVLFNCSLALTPTGQPTSQPTSSPSSTVFCYAGGYVNAGVCSIVPAGYYTSTPSATSYRPCTDAVLPGAAGCNSYAAVVTRLAGSATTGYADGIGTNAKFYSPWGVTVDSVGAIYVGDADNRAIRKLTTAGVVTTIGAGGSSVSPLDLVVDSNGLIYFADANSNAIKTMTPSGAMTRVAGGGSGIVSGYTDGIGTGALFNSPKGLAFDSVGNLFVADTYNNAIRKITPTGTVTTFVGAVTSGKVDGIGTSARFVSPYRVCFTSQGNLFVADTENHIIRSVTPAAVVTRVAGGGSATGAVSGYQDGAGSAAMFKYPSGIVVNKFGVMFVGDQGNNLIRRISPSGVVTTLAGGGSPGGTASGSSDGIGTSARFYSPIGLAMNSVGVLFVTDDNNEIIRMITPADPCSQSQVLSNGICISVPAGFYRPVNTLSGITYLCPVDTYSSSGSSSCLACPSGTSSSLGSSQCLDTRPTGQPTSQPSIKPSVQPTVQPSIQPSRQPIGRPSAQPSCQPTRLPTSRPSAQPSRQPSGQPTTHPSCQPTRLPTSRPSAQPSQPSGQPSTHPSCQPTRQPTSRPSAQPSRQPSGHPTTHPSCQPTRQPTSQPSAQPSRQPSGQPSTHPSCQPTRQPTSRPSAQPSRQPSGHPTTHPSCQPTRQPTSRPSAQPSRQPSGQPSSRPSNEPSNQPSAQPTRVPSLHPSDAPTTPPSRQPSNQPTMQPTRQPTAIPSSAVINVPNVNPTLPPTQLLPSISPTVLVYTFESWKLKYNQLRYDRTTWSKSWLRQGDVLLEYDEAWFQGNEIAANAAPSACNRWNVFLNQLFDLLPMNNLIEFQIYVETVVAAQNTTIVCSASTSGDLKSSFYGAFFAISGSIPSPVAVQCGVGSGQTVTLTSGVCNNNPYLNISAENWHQVVAPCSKSCIPPQGDLDAGRILYLSAFLHPKYSAPGFNVSWLASTRLSLTIAINTTSPGIVYCSAYIQGIHAIPATVSQLQLQSSSTVATSNATILVLESLVSSTVYEIFCLASGSAGVVSTLEYALDRKIVAKTECCVAISVDVTPLVVSSNSPMSTATFTVERLPIDSLSIQLSATDIRGAPIDGVIAPEMVVFASSSANLVARSNILTSIACKRTNMSVVISATLIGPEADRYAVLFARGNVLPCITASSILAAPGAVTAIFSDDGSTVEVKFNAATNQAKLGIKIFICSSLFAFSGSTQSRCQWNSDGSQLTIWPQFTSSLAVGSVITVYGKLLKARCAFSQEQCSSYPSSVQTNVSIEAPRDGLSPTVVIFSASSIGSCEPLSIDLTSSLGSGGRPWKSIAVSISSTNANLFTLQNFVDMKSLQMQQHLAYFFEIPSHFLNPGSLYSFSLKLCNFLDKCGHGYKTVAVMEKTGAPNIRIAGLTYKSMKVADTLSLKAIASSMTCGSRYRSDNLTYHWLILRGNSSTPVALGIGESLMQFPNLFVNAYSLSPGAFYNIIVRVGRLNSPVSSEASTTVMVSVGRLVAVVASGSSFSQRQGSLTALDGSFSYDEDQPRNLRDGIGYQWLCQQLAPYYNVSCPFAALADTSSMIAYSTVSMDPQARNITLKYTLIVITGDEANLRTSSCEAIASVIPASFAVPKIQVDSQLLTRIVTSNSITIPAVIIGSTSLIANCSWKSDVSLNVEAASLTPVRYLVPWTIRPQEYSATLVLAKDSLVGGSSYQFTLECSSLGIGSYSLSSVQISTNAQPTPGVFEVSPVSGVEIGTVFSFQAFAWTDRNEDYPLTFEISVISPFDGSILVLSSRSIAARMMSALPAGNIACNLNVYDSNDAFASVIFHVNVTKMGELSALVISNLTKSIRIVGIDPDFLKQVIVPMGTSSGLAARCDWAPNCTRLNRKPCTTITNTCGSCVTSQFIGTLGSSNDPCVSLSEAVESSQVKDTICSENRACNSPWYRCDLTAHVCQPLHKSCSFSCGGSKSGNCIYRDIASGIAVNKCFLDDPTCAAVCECNSGYTGVYCTDNANLLALQAEVQSHLLTALLHIMSGENVNDRTTVNSWANIIATLSATAKNLSASHLASYSDIIASIVASPVIGTDQNAVQLAIDNCFASSLGVGVGTNGTNSTEGLLRSLSAFSEAVVRGLVQNQDPSDFIGATLRIRREVVSSGANISIGTISVPQDSSEVHAGVKAISVFVQQSADPMPLAVTSLQSQAFAHMYDIPSSNSSVQFRRLSNPVRLQLPVLAHCANAGKLKHAPKVTFVLPHAISQTTGENEIISEFMQPFVTRCRRGEVFVVNFTCATGLVISHSCLGLSNYRLVSSCPVPTVVPSCNAFASNGINPSCEVVNFTDTELVCSCSLCDDISTVRRRLASADSFIIQTQAISMYLASDYVSVITQAEDINAQTFAKSDIILITFSCLWSVLVGMIVMLEWSGFVDKFQEFSHKLGMRNAGRRITIVPESKISGHRQSEIDSLHTLQTPAIAQATKLSLRSYIFSFLPNIYSEKSSTIKFWHELLHRHRYISVFAREKGFRKFVGLLEILSSLTFHFFMIAVLYDVEYPHDDGSCEQHVNEISCLKQKSMFNAKRTQCEWVPSPQDSNDYFCIWQNPQYDDTTQLVITMMVVVMSGPFNVILSLIVNKILLARTASEIETIKKSRTTQRKTVAVGIRETLRHNARQQTVVHSEQSVPRSNAGKSIAMTRRDSIMTAFAAKGNRQTESRHSFSMMLQESVLGYDVVDDVDESLDAYCNDAERGVLAKLSMKRRTTMPTTLFADVKCKIDTSQFIQDLNRVESKLAADESHKSRFERFNAQWGAVLIANRVRVASRSGDSQHHADAIDSLTKSILEVETEANKLIEELSRKPDYVRGVCIMDTFLLDLMGRDSPAAKIYINQRVAVKENVVFSWTIKIIFVCLMLLANAYLILSCMLYGVKRGHEWQLEWMISCVAYLSVDIFVKNSSLVFIVFFAIPSSTGEATTRVKQRLYKAVRNLLDANGKAEDDIEADTNIISKFSVTDTLFVSHQLAKAFPAVMESSLVLAYRDLTVSDIQAQDWSQDPSSRQALQFSSLLRGCRSSMDMSLFRRSFSLILYFLILKFGSQSIFVQKLLVQVIDPIILSFFAFIGSKLFSRGNTGVPLCAAVVTIGFCIFGYYTYQTDHKKRLQSIQDEASNDVYDDSSEENEIQPAPYSHANHETSADTAPAISTERTSFATVNRQIPGLTILGHSREARQSIMPAVREIDNEGINDEEDCVNDDNVDPGLTSTVGEAPTPVLQANVDAFPLSDSNFRPPSGTQDQNSKPAPRKSRFAKLRINQLFSTQHAKPTNLDVAQSTASVGATGGDEAVGDATISTVSESKQRKTRFSMFFDYYDN